MFWRLSVGILSVSAIYQKKKKMTEIQASSVKEKENLKGNDGASRLIHDQQRSQGCAIDQAEANQSQRISLKVLPGGDAV